MIEHQLAGAGQLEALADTPEQRRSQLVLELLMTRLIEDGAT